MRDAAQSLAFAVSWLAGSLRNGMLAGWADDVAAHRAYCLYHREV
jgi:hypothetical protein